mgnify:FL=1
MDKVGKKCRDISFRSEKNQKLVCVHSREAREYARILESDNMVVSYEACQCLDITGQCHLVNALQYYG